MSIFSMLGRGSAILIGIACISVDTGSNLEFVAGGSIPRDLTDWNFLMAAVVAVSLATVVALAAAGAAWRRRQPLLAAGLAVAFLCGAGFSLSATLDRAGSQRDAAVGDMRSHNVMLQRTQTALSEERGKLATANAAIAIECARYNHRRHKPEDWPRCFGAKGQAETATGEIARLRATLATLGAEKVEDSMGTRIAALIPGVTPTQVQTYQPVLLPVALFLFGNLLVSFGLAGSNAPRVAPPQAVSAEASRPMRDITPPDPVVLALDHAGRPMNNGELAQVMGWSDATATRVGKKLARTGQVRRWREGREIMISVI